MSDNPYTAPRTDLDLESHTDGDHPIVLASRFKRFVARVVDNIIVGLLMFLILLPFTSQLLKWNIVTVPQLPVPPTEGQGSIEFLVDMYVQAFLSAEQLLGTVLGLIIYFVIQGRLLYLYGQTCGKWLLRIKIVMNETNTKPDLSTSFAIREIGLTIISLIPILNIINVLMIFGSRRRCLHDHISKTKVINVH